MKLIFINLKPLESMMRTISNLLKRNEKLIGTIEKEKNETALKWIYVYYTDELFITYISYTTTATLFTLFPFQGGVYGPCTLTLFSKSVH